MGLLFGFIIILAIPVLPIGLVLMKIGKLELKGKLLQARCQRCVFCFYDLSQRSPEIDTCPECGEFAPRRECVRLWCKLLRSRF